MQPSALHSSAGLVTATPPGSLQLSLKCPPWPHWLHPYQLQHHLRTSSNQLLSSFMPLQRPLLHTPQHPSKPTTLSLCSPRAQCHPSTGHPCLACSSGAGGQGMQLSRLPPQHTTAQQPQCAGPKPGPTSQHGTSRALCHGHGLNPMAGPWRWAWQGGVGTSRQLSGASVLQQACLCSHLLASPRRQQPTAAPTHQTTAT